MRELRILSPRLPYRTRARLRIEHHLTSAGAWLIDHGHTGAAERLWRACRCCDGRRP